MVVHDENDGYRSSAVVIGRGERGKVGDERRKNKDRGRWSDIRDFATKTQSRNDKEDGEENEGGKDMDEEIEQSNAPTKAQSDKATNRQSDEATKRRGDEALKRRRTIATPGRRTAGYDDSARDRVGRRWGPRVRR